MRRDAPIDSERCPEPEVWARMAAGACAPAQQNSLLDHAATCAACADRLRDLLDAVADDGAADPAADGVAGTLAIQREAVRRKLAAEMARRKGPWQRSWLIPLAAMLVVTGGIGGWFLSNRSSSPPFRQLAAAYSARRNLELQIPGAAYAPIRVERGPGASLADLPPSLLESQAQIKKHLDRQPADPDWLHAQGRAALLLWDFDTAIRAFQTASDLGAKSPAFLVDFGTAYFERAEKNAASIDYALALEKVGQALQQQPDNPAALFNRAVIRGKLHQYDPAIADLDQYIRRETDPGWREEARRLRDDLRRRRALLFDRDHAVAGERQAELDLETVLTSGLRAHFRARSPELEATAAALVEAHQDPWLLEAARLAATPALVRMVDALSEIAGLRTVAGTEYARAAADIQFLEAALLPRPLRVWRDYELLYRTTRTAAVANCPDTAGLRQAVRGYPWFEAQIVLESSLCAAGRQDFTGAAALVDEAERVATLHNLGATLIRMPNFRGQRLVETGFCNEAIQLANQTLAKLESGGYPLRRAYDFHVIIMKAAAQLNLPHTAWGAASMMSIVGRGAGSRLFEMIAQSHRAHFALLLGWKPEAEQAYTAAENAFRESGGNADAGLYLRVARAGWMEARQDRETLYRMLREARGEGAAKKENLYFNRKLIAALCRLELRAGRPSAVEELAEPFWREITEAAFAQPGALRTYLPEIESVSRSLTAARLMAGKPEDALGAWQRFVGLNQRLLGSREATAAAAAMDEGAAVLTIAELDGKAALWLQTHAGTGFRWAAGSYGELVARVRLLRRLASLAAAPEDRIAAEARRLYATLFPSGTGAATRVFLQARGELNALPLSTFSYAPEGREVAFSFLPFGGKLPFPARPERVTIIGATVFDRKLGGLDDLERSIGEEVDAVGGAFRQRSVVLGVSATARALEDAAMVPGVLHFAGHAIPWHGGIGLVVAPDAADAAQDGRAGVWALAEPKQMKSDLVVFSACRTGEFDDPASVRPGQLTEAALLAGAGEVVATLWDVDSAATAVWMKLFYAQLAAGQPPPAALRMASLEMRTKAEWRHPRYWAGFADYSRVVERNSIAEAGGRRPAVNLIARGKPWHD